MIFTFDDETTPAVEIETAPRDESLSTGETGPTVLIGTPPRCGLGSAVAQLVGRLVHLIVNVASGLAVIRYLDPPQYGDYVVVTTVMLAGLLANSGLAKLAIREVAQGTVSERSAIGSVAVLRLVLSAAALLISQLLSQGLDIGVRLFGEVVETASLLLMTAANVAFLALRTDAADGIRDYVCVPGAPRATPRRDTTFSRPGPFSRCREGFP